MSERGGQRVTYGNGIQGLNHQQVIEKIRECRTNNEMIFLTILVGSGRDVQFNETIAMRIAILENIDLIIGFAMYNVTTGRGRHEYSAWFNWFLTFLSTDHQGKTKHLTYNCFSTGPVYISLEDGNKFATAIQLNNNDGHIESFSLHALFNETEALETIWNMLLATGVPHVSLGLAYPPNETETNLNLNLPNLATNTTLKQLDLTDIHPAGSPLAGLLSTYFFDAMKVNKGIEKLIFGFGGTLLQEKEMVTRFEEMLRENSTLINVEASIHFDHNDAQQALNRFITIETKFNRMWKQYIIHREATAAATAAAAATITANASTTTTVEVDNNNNERERKKRLKMRMLLNLFMNKPVLRNTIIFHLVSGYPHDLVGNNEKIIDSDDHDDGTDGDTNSDSDCNVDSCVSGTGSGSDDNTTCTL